MWCCLTNGIHFQSPQSNVCNDINCVNKSPFVGEVPSLECDWSASVGVCENQAKAVAVVPIPARRTTLRRELPQVVQLDVELLGSCSMVSRRGLLPREHARVDSCCKTLTLLACARLPFERYMRACRQFAVAKVAYGWIARAPPLTLSKKLRSLVRAGSGRIRAASVWLRAAWLGGGMHLDVFATQLVGIFSLLQWSRALTWSTCRGSPAHAFDSWLASHGWDRTAEWKWTHSDSGCRLDFLLPVTLVSVSMLFETLGVLGACVVTWRPSDGMLSLTAFIMLPDIFARLTGMLLASLPLPVRKLGPWLVVPLSLLLLLVVSSSFHMCIWDGCTELGTFDHIAWECPRRPCNTPKPAEFLFSRYGWVVTNQVCDIDAVHGLVGSCARGALVPCSSMTCACLYHGPSHFPVYWSCPFAHSVGLPCLRGLPLWVWLGLFGSLPPWFPFSGVFRWAVCTFGVVWAPWPPDAMESFVPVGPLPSVFMACFRVGLLRLLLWLPPRSALSIFLWAVQIKVHTRLTTAEVCFANLPSTVRKTTMRTLFNPCWRTKRTQLRWWVPGCPNDPPAFNSTMFFVVLHTIQYQLNQIYCFLMLFAYTCMRRLIFFAVV